MSSRELYHDVIESVEEYSGAKVKLAICDIDGVLRGKVIHKNKFLSIVDDGFGFCDVVFGWDSSDKAYDNIEFTGWHTGYPDAKAKVDLSTFRRVPWDNEIPFFLADFWDFEGNPLPICPRNLFKTIIAQTAEMGFTPIFSQEFEWFNFKENPQELKEKDFRHVQPMTPGMFGYSILRSSLKSSFYNDLFDLLRNFDVPLEGLHTETGPGVYEAAIAHSEALESADRAVLFKTGVKEIAFKHELMASFMAKWDPNLPGCSGHIHQSLWNLDQSQNLFYNGKRKYGMSKIMKSYLAGQLYCLPYILPMYAPTINSYKRLVEGAWAPTTVTWGLDNRTTAIRVLTNSSKSARLEMRVCGSDVNPYLAMSAALASGLYGIRRDLKLDQPHTVGNGYQDFNNGLLPGDLNEASQAMKHSEVATELFGSEFLNHFIQTREWEWREYSRSVTDWELRRYFEII